MQDSINFKLLINNNWEEPASGNTISITSPWDGQEVGKVAASSQEQAIEAVMAADNAFKNWRYTTLYSRIELLEKIADRLEANIDRLTQLLHREIAKFEDDARSEIERSISYIRLVCEAARHQKGHVYRGDIDGKYDYKQKTGIYERVPLGVILAISPFNYPINLSITKVAPALLAGNTVVLKPSTQGSITSYEFYKHFIEAGLPQGVLNVVTGKSSVIGDPLLTHDKVKLIAFTGSTEVGNHIREVAKGVPLLLELGGKDVGIVSDKANLELAATHIVKGAFSYCGQRCTAQKTVLVYESVADELTDLLLSKTQGMELNPMIDKAAADYVRELIADAVEKGADRIMEDEGEDNKLGANILDNVTEDMRLFHEEQFGPVMPIVRVAGMQEAITYANSSRFGLQASVYTRDIDEAFKIADKLEVGTVQINAKPDRGPDNFPFGGVKDSGQLMQGTVETIEKMTRGKLTVVNLA